MTPAAPWLLLLALAWPAAGLAQGLPHGAPAAEGFSPERLDRIEPFLRAATGAQGYLGAVTLVARHGKVVRQQALGHRDLARRVPMTADSIFRIYSMTKTVASVALLMLIEEGQLSLDDPVARHLSEFASLRVLAGGSAEAPVLRVPARPLTVRHLLTHTAGFAVARPMSAATSALQGADLASSPDLREFAARVARAPLALDPGQRFVYDGVQTEVVARLVEVLSGQPFDAFLAQRVFGPLRMRDTGFEVPQAERHRVVDITAMAATGTLVAAPGLAAAGERLRPYPSGAGGLYSTAADYARLCQMLLSGGTLDGATILGRKTVESMFANHLLQTDPPPGLPADRFSPSEGFGLGGYVLLDPARRGRLGSVGTFGWSGSAATYYFIDPKEELFAILLLQHLHRDGNSDDLPKLFPAFNNLVYQALAP